MNGQIIEQNLLKISEDIRLELLSKASSLEPQQKTAAKAYNICIGVLNQASKMVSMKFSDKSYDEKYYLERLDLVKKCLDKLIINGIDRRI